MGWPPTRGPLGRWRCCKRSEGCSGDTQCVYRSQRFRAGGQRQAGEHRAERLRRPPRLWSGAAPPHR
eukprot:3065201-Prymnesium_polylepis.1